MDTPGSPHDAPTPPANPAPAPAGPSSKKRKHAALANVAAASPAPSDPDTPGPSAVENVVLSTRHMDLATRPRLTISRHPSFVPLHPASEYYNTEPLCNNRLNFRYSPAGLSPLGSILPFRTIESAPTAFRVSWEDRSPFVKVSQDGLGLKGDKGFRSARCNAPVREGKWYMEVKIERGGGEKPDGSKRREGSHIRLGWARREAPLNAPAGLDGYSYAYRDKTGEKVHLSRPRPYGAPFRSGDVVGMYISLPPRRKPNPKDPRDPAHIRRERIAIEFKGQEYWESLEYPQSKEMLSLMEANTRAKAAESGPLPPSATKKSATVKNLPSTSRGARGAPPEPAPLRPLPTLGPDAHIAFFVNGAPQGIAFQDLFDYLPLRAPGNKAQEKNRRAKEGLREHKVNHVDDGTLGYYPFISLFNEARVRINPGPDFEYPPPPDIDAVLSAAGADGDIKPPAPDAPRTWRPMCERYPEFIAEQRELDDREEADARAAQQGEKSDKPDADKTEQEMAKLEAHRAKRRAQAAARRERKLKAAQEEAAAREAKKRKLERETSAAPAEPLGDAGFRSEDDHTGLLSTLPSLSLPGGSTRRSSAVPKSPSPLYGAHTDARGALSVASRDASQYNSDDGFGEAETETGSQIFDLASADTPRDLSAFGIEGE
ncbi:hypothetical protein OBBRIDRAFT_607267 [Obba rivulosa]|uniref:B30.2/SPRY domain-containing protein n=1 Tax=Obba rivulosa TaxID=1052685 RepID=A0A8E2ATG2_9APHY|nr:hypothetical protein OBBRIDRAFT_607267 [Obba rivulosa]